MSEDFEALGHYIAAKEQAERIARERDMTLSTLNRLISNAVGSRSSSTIATDLDIAKARELLEKAAELNQNLHTIVQEANNYADACKRQKLEIWQIPTHY